LLKLTPSKDKLRWLLGLTGISLVSASAGAFLAVSLNSTPLLQRQLSAAEAAVFGLQGSFFTGLGIGPLPGLTRPVHVLVLGTKVLTSDLAGEPHQTSQGYHALVNSLDGLSDTMLLLRFDPETEQLTALSIPRDTRTRVEGYGETKINEANAVGGPALSAKSVSELLGGVGIDRYVRVNVQGIEKLVDALGGVTVYVPKDMKYRDDSQHLYIDLKAGKQHLNGEQVLQFLRFRYDDWGDIGRIQRQQLLMRALVEQTLNPTTVTRLPELLAVLQAHLDTNLTVEELMSLAGFAGKAKRSNVQMLMVPGRFSTPEEYQASYWLPDHERIQTMTAQYFGLSQLAPETQASDPALLRVAIQDSTGQTPIVEDLIDTLNRAGYKNVYVAAPWGEPLPVTRIVVQQGDVASARTLHQHLGLGEVQVENTGILGSDVTIQLGQDWNSHRPELSQSH